MGQVYYVFQFQWDSEAEEAAAAQQSKVWINKRHDGPIANDSPLLSLMAENVIS